MEFEDQLLTYIEISIALAGFSGIVAAFQFRDDRRVTRGDVLGLTMLLTISLAAAFCAGLALLLLNFGLETEMIWSVMSIVMVLNNIGFIYVGTRGALKIGALTKQGRLVVAFMQLSMTAVSVILAMNAFGIVFERMFAPVSLQFVSALSLAGMLFARLLIRPIVTQLRYQHRRRKKA